jgi:hypothetical protein
MIPIINQPNGGRSSHPILHARVLLYTHLSFLNGFGFPNRSFILFQFTRPVLCVLCEVLCLVVELLSRPIPGIEVAFFLIISRLCLSIFFSIHHRNFPLLYMWSHVDRCQPVNKIAFMKTHKCASSTIENVLFRYEHSFFVSVPK